MVSKGKVKTFMENQTNVGPVMDETVTPEMYQYFIERTYKHKRLVMKYCRRIQSEMDVDDLVELGEQHDESKFSDPEIVPYIHITWRYKKQDEDVDYEIPDHIDDNKATKHHIKTNKHHPDYWSDQEELLNDNDRDSVPDSLIDATDMPKLYLLEMVADWCAMGEEKGNSAEGWADKNIGERWKFTEEQQELIYEAIEVAENYGGS